MYIDQTTNIKQNPMRHNPSTSRVYYTGVLFCLITVFNLYGSVLAGESNDLTVISGQLVVLVKGDVVQSMSISTKTGSVALAIDDNSRSLIKLNGRLIQASGYFVRTGDKQLFYLTTYQLIDQKS